MGRRIHITREGSHRLRPRHPPPGGARAAQRGVPRRSSWGSPPLSVGFPAAQRGVPRRSAWGYPPLTPPAELGQGTFLLTLLGSPPPLRQVLSSRSFCRQVEEEDASKSRSRSTSMSKSKSYSDAQAAFRHYNNARPYLAHSNALSNPQHMGNPFALIGRMSRPLASTESTQR
eukprot:439035-Prorocentrum_minimum.AAC.1